MSNAVMNIVGHLAQDRPDKITGLEVAVSAFYGALARYLEADTLYGRCADAETRKRFPEFVRAHGWGRRVVALPGRPTQHLFDVGCLFHSTPQLTPLGISAAIMAQTASACAASPIPCLRSRCWTN